ncbi:MAG: ferredoxin--NADP reductase [Nitrospinae bacterium]|nr:ferredoxin--NADP reductase [Nitrospinota bacterium]
MADNELNAQVVSMTEVAPGLMILRVKPVGWEIPDFAPGQFAVLALPGSAPRHPVTDPEETPPPPDKLIKRAYSIASSSRTKEYMELYITLIRSGALTPRLFSLKVGDMVFLAPNIKGAFKIDQARPGSHIVMFATGTGLAPFMSAIRTIFGSDMSRRYVIVHGARHSWDLGYRPELATLASQSPNFTYIPVLSRPDDEKTGWSGAAGYVQDVWRLDVINAEAGFQPTPDNSSVFICGNPDMTESMVDLLGADGFREHSKKEPGQIFVERYW